MGDLEFYVRVNDLRDTFHFPRGNCLVGITGVSPSECCEIKKKSIKRCDGKIYFRTDGVMSIDYKDERAYVQFPNMMRGGMCTTGVPFSELAVKIKENFIVPFEGVKDKIIFRKKACA